MGSDAGTMIFYGFEIPLDEVEVDGEEDEGEDEGEDGTAVEAMFEARLRDARLDPNKLPCRVRHLRYESGFFLLVVVARSVREDANPAPLGDTTVQPGWDEAVKTFCGQIGIEPRRPQWMFATWSLE